MKQLCTCPLMYNKIQLLYVSQRGQVLTASNVQILNFKFLLPVVKHLGISVSTKIK